MKKGFTLAELIAVLVVLSLISMIAIPAVTKTLKTYKGEICEVQLNSIIEAGRSWGAKNMNKLPADGEETEVLISDLIKYGFIDENLVNPKTGEKFTSDWKIKIVKQGKKFIYSILNNDGDVSISNYCE